jgi:hypothetical protein
MPQSPIVSPDQTGWEPQPTPSHFLWPRPCFAIATFRIFCAADDGAHTNTDDGFHPDPDDGAHDNGATGSALPQPGV